VRHTSAVTPLQLREELLRAATQPARSCDLARVADLFGDSALRPYVVFDKLGAS
jgi:hypothetical protein